MTSGSDQKFLPGWWACVVACAVVLGALVVAGEAVSAEMRSKKIDRNLCKTTGGGKFVRIPNSNGEMIDRRLLPDVRWMQREYKIGVGDGYAPTGHAPQGEHPIGLALDIYSVRGSRGWDKIDKLARLAEPRPDQPRLPWRWVGYDGDSGHGRGHHLHLSWAHNDRTTPREPAKWVLTRTCPGEDSRDGGGGGGGGGDGGGGIGTRSASAFDLPALRDLAPPVPETR